MHYVLIIHEVENYSKWKTIFDAAAQIRKEAGEISYRLLKFQTNPSSIAHLSRWNSLQNAKDFFESEQLVEIRKQAGVKAPQFFYLDEIESGIL